MRENSRRMALCGVLVALSTTALLLGSLLPLATFCGPILAVVVLLPILPEFGPRFAWVAHGATATLALLLAPDRELALVYLFLGVYPLLRPYLQRIPLLPLRVVCKLLLCNFALLVLYGLLIFLFQLETVTAELSAASATFLALLLALANANFWALDLVIARLSQLWTVQLRRKIFKI